MNARIQSRPIDEPAAWTAAALGDDPKARLAYRLRERHFAAIDRLLARVGDREVQSIRPEEVDDPDFLALADDVLEILAHGVGAVVVEGLTRERYDERQFAAIFWSLGIRLGSPTVQTNKGDRMTHVTRDPNHPTPRGYRGSGELSPHNDAYAILALMCVQRAESGGYSHLASALAIHEEIRRTRPELLPALYEGTRYATMDARGTDIGPTHAPVPLFSSVDGRISCFFSRQNSTEAVHQSGTPMSPAFEEAAAHFEALARDPRFRVEFMMDPGDIMIVNNYVLVHARTEFQDSPRHKRDLLRLWLNNAGMRPVVPELHLFAQLYDALFKAGALVKVS